MQVDGSDLEVAMAEQYLNGAQVGSGFEQVCGETMPQGVRMDVPVPKSGAFGGDLAGSTIGPWWSQGGWMCASGCRERATPSACAGVRASRRAVLRAASG